MNNDSAQWYSLDSLQKISLSLMSGLVLLTFLATNIQAVLWQSSEWLVSTVLPAVVVDLTNEERLDNNATPLRRNRALDEAARLKAQHMVENQYFAHYAPDGTSPWFWFKEAEYTYAHAGENLAIHFTDSEEVVEAWMDSPLHRKNIIDSKFTEIGVGTAKGAFEGFDTVYVVQLFGTPALVPAEAPSRTTRPVAESAAIALAPEVVDVNIPEGEVSVETESAVAPVESVLSETETIPVVIEPVLTAGTANLEVEAIAVNIPAEPPVFEAVTITNNQNQAIAETFDSEVFIIEQTMIATSSGLTVATMVEDVPNEDQQTRFGIATRPHFLLEVVYIAIIAIIGGLLIISMVAEFKRRHMLQVAYSIGLFVLMGGLWFLHSYLMAGALIV